MATARGTVPQPQGHFMTMQEAWAVSSTSCFIITGAGCLLAAPDTMFLCVFQIWVFQMERVHESSFHDLCLPNCGEQERAADGRQPSRSVCVREPAAAASRD